MAGAAPTLSRWPEIERVLAEVIELPATQREACIERLCVNDPVLAIEVRHLLTHENALPDALSATCFEALADDVAEDDAIGARIGPFVIEALIGEGGMSRVYRANRAADFRQRVAIKLLRTLPDAQAMRRFRNERDALAALEHPGIARLLDAGVLANGAPYLALELVEGRLWPVWLAGCASTLPARIEPLLQVCDALQYAHAHSLIHRDIKPANLMLGDDGRVRLLDFGVARLLESGTGTLTREGGVALTPAYAAPEQWRGESVTTATDIYSLGLVIHETLSGTRYFSAATWQEAMARAQAPVPLPSALATQAGLPARLLRGDVDNIVRKACDPDPLMRYDSVAALASDLRALLDGRPVSARAPTFAYVARKFVGRHPVATTLGALGLIAILVATTFALREGQRAEQRFMEARMLANRTLFDYSHGLAEIGGTLPMRRRMVDDGLRYLDSLRTTAGSDASLWADLARGYLEIGDLLGHPWKANLGDFGAAAQRYKDARGARMQWLDLGGPSAEIAAFDARLRLREAGLDHEAGRLDAAAVGYREALSAFAANADDAIDVRLEQAEANEYYGDLLADPAHPSLLDEAASGQQHREARALREAALAEKPDDDHIQFTLAGSLMREGDAALVARNLDVAESTYARASALVERSMQAAPENAIRRRQLAAIDSRLTQVLEQQGRFDDAIKVAERGVQLTEALLAVDPSNDHLRQGAGAILGALAKLLIQQQRLAEATPVVERQIAVNRARLESSPDNSEMQLALSLSFRRQGELRASLGDLAGAIVAHEQALALQEPIAKQSAWYDSNRSISLLHLGRLHQRAGDQGRALTRLQGARTIIAALLEAYPDTPMFIEDLADADEAIGDASPVSGRAEHYRQGLATLATLSADSISPATMERRERLARKLSDPR